MKSNLWTIVGKEFARFFGDRQLVFTTLLLPPLLIYVVYSLMGMGVKKIATEGADDIVTLTVENMPPSMAALLPDGVGQGAAVLNASFGQDEVDALTDKKLNTVLMRFPAGFDGLVAAYSPQSGLPAPNVEIYYNSSNNASARVYGQLSAMLSAYEDGLANRFDVNRADTGEEVFDQADIDDVLGNYWSKLLPMLIVMMIASGVVSISTTAIAGEKERGTIATLLVTPMRRNDLALGKILSISFISLLSGVASFVGIALSLPKMMQSDAVGLEMGFHYTLGDYAALLLVILSLVVVMAACMSLLSALAKDSKNAGTMITPMMIVLMLCGLLPMFLGDAAVPLPVYLIPIYNGVQTMVDLFAHRMQWLPTLLTVGSSLLYTAVAAWGLTRMFGSEKIMFGK